MEKQKYNLIKFNKYTFISICGTVIVSLLYLCRGLISCIWVRLNLYQRGFLHPLFIYFLLNDLPYLILSTINLYYSKKGKKEGELSFYNKPSLFLSYGMFLIILLDIFQTYIIPTAA